MESIIRSCGTTSPASLRMFSSRVSASTRQLPCTPPSLSALIFICLALSSPDTYRVRRFSFIRGICRLKVDFPMPGSPPRSTREPFTIPPPRTLSSSFPSRQFPVPAATSFPAHPSRILLSFPLSIWGRGWGLALPIP